MSLTDLLNQLQSLGNTDLTVDNILARAIVFTVLILVLWFLLLLLQRKRALRAARILEERNRKWVIIDGSNVMYWHEGTPKLKTVIAVIRYLEDRGYYPGIMFDANAGHLLFGRYAHDEKMGRMLGLSPERVMVVPKGTPADPAILTAARDLGGRIVTNDRFRDWAGDYPEVRKKGHLIQGQYKSGRLTLRLGKTAETVNQTTRAAS